MNFDETHPYILNLWIETKKTPAEFESNLNDILAPVVSTNGRFSLGGINFEIEHFKDKVRLDFIGVPSAEYDCCINVRIVDCGIWGCIDRRFTYSIAKCLRTKFQCRYLITADQTFFVLFSGTNLPVYVNREYGPAVTGELGIFGGAGDCVWVDSHRLKPA